MYNTNELEPLDLALARHLYLNLNIRNPRGLFFVFGSYQGSIACLVHDYKEQKDKLYLIQLIYGTCPVCDPIEAIIEDNKTKLDKQIKYLDIDEKKILTIYYSLTEIIEQIFVPATFEFNFSQIFENNEMNYYDAYQFLKLRAEKGLLPLSWSTDILEYTVYEIQGYKYRTTLQIDYPIGLNMNKIIKVNYDE